MLGRKIELGDNHLFPYSRRMIFGKTWASICRAAIVIVTLPLQGTGGGHHHHAPANMGRAFAIGVILNLAMFFAYRRIFRPVQDCNLGEVCAVPAVRRRQRAVFWAVASIAAALMAFPLYAPLFY